MLAPIPIIKFLIDPFTVLGILLFVAIGAAVCKRERLLKWSVIATGIWFIIISTPLIPTLVTRSLEHRYTPVDIADIHDPNAEYHIIILGGGHGFDERLPANSLLSRRALGRLIEGVRLHRQLPNSKLVLSGFSASGQKTQAEMLQETALLLGVQKKATLLQVEPANTYEEAKIYVSNYGTGHPVIIITSAVHMPRAMKTFNAFGVDAIASPTNYRLKGNRKSRWIGLPALSHVEKLSISTSEYAGIWWYHFKYLKFL